MEQKTNFNLKGMFKTIGGKLITILLGLSFAIILLLSSISYFLGSSAISNEASKALSGLAELKTSGIESFLNNNYGDVHIMTGLDLIKNTADEYLHDIQKSNVKPSFSIEQKRDYFFRTSEAYRLLHQYVGKYFKDSGNYLEMKFAAMYDLKNRYGQVVFREGDQIMSVGNYIGNVIGRSCYKGGMELANNRKEGTYFKESGCPFLYCSSIEHNGELNHTTIKMSHPLGRHGLSMSEMRANTSIKSRFSFMLIIDTNTDKIDHLCQDRTGMGQSGETYLIQNVKNRVLMVTNSRFEDGTALKKDLSSSSGLVEHLRRNEHKRGKAYCTDIVYKDYRGIDVLAHNHMIKIGDHDVGIITEIDEQEVFSATSDLLWIMIPIGFAVLVVALFVAIFFSRSISWPLKYSVDFATVIADGDLTQKIDEIYLKRPDEIGDLARSLDKMGGNLQGMISNIILSAQNLSQAVDQISIENQDLSQRTSEQASSLEEIASSIEETSATIKKNSENALEAKNMSNESSTMAVDGGEVVSKAVESINEINELGKKIGEIITMINEISFQTNLLALNAAVEAARAGEQGRGFAVVAGEIRNLAQRSGNFAKEIGDLIKDSVYKIDTGTELVNKSGDALKKIIGSTENVGNIVAEISAASQEQRQGIDQVNISITQMDTMTQQNAALVEETAAAGEEMAAQSRDLLELVESFKIDSDVKKNMSSFSKQKEIHIKRTNVPKKIPEESSIRKEESHQVKPQKHQAAAEPNKEGSKDLSDTLTFEGFDEF